MKLYKITIRFKFQEPQTKYIAANNLSDLAGRFERTVLGAGGGEEWIEKAECITTELAIINEAKPKR